MGGTAFISSAAARWNEFSPQLSANTAIIWKASTNNLPNSFWIYRRHGPRIFPSTILSNAMVLASLQSRGIPKPSTKDFFIWEDRGPNYPGPIPSIFCVRPAPATISYWKPHADRGSAIGVPIDSNLVTRARSELSRLSVDPKQVKLKNLTSSFCTHDEAGRDVPKQLCGRGVFFARQLDGIPFFGTGDDGSGEGFWIEFGSQGQIRAFSLNWPDLDRLSAHQTASPTEIIKCIRKQKVMFLPQGDEPGYFARIKHLATAKSLIINKVTPYYAEDVFGDVPTNDVPAELVVPLAELETTADFGNSNVSSVVVSPILSSEVLRLLRNKAE